MYSSNNMLESGLKCLFKAFQFKCTHYGNIVISLMYVMYVNASNNTPT